MTQPRVLITGAAGFLGSHVADHCLALGMTVVANDDLSGGVIENVPVGCVWIKGDLCDRRFVEEELFGQYGPFDYVYHLAAYAAEGLSHHCRVFNYQNNLIASANLINCAVETDVKCFVFASSCAVYGHSETPVTEHSLLRPIDPYGIAKYAVELDLLAASRYFGLSRIVFRPHNVYGERQNVHDPYRNVVGIFMRQCVAGQPMTVFGDGQQVRCFSHVSDVAPVIARSPLIPEARGGTFNVGSGETSTILELARRVDLAVHKGRSSGVEIECLPARQEAHVVRVDHSLAYRIFGLTNPTSLSDGLGRMARWLEEWSWPSQSKLPEIEVAKNLPPSWKR